MLLSDRIRISLQKPSDFIVEIVQVVLRTLHPLEGPVGGIHPRQAQLDAVLQVALKVTRWAHREPPEWRGEVGRNVGSQAGSRLRDTWAGGFGGFGRDDGPPSHQLGGGVASDGMAVCHNSIGEAATAARPEKQDYPVKH